MLKMESLPSSWCLNAVAPMDGGTTELACVFTMLYDIMDVICHAMAVEMHSWGASAVCTYLSFAIIAFFVGIWTWN